MFKPPRSPKPPEPVGRNRFLGTQVADPPGIDLFSLHKKPVFARSAGCWVAILGLYFCACRPAQQTDPKPEEGSTRGASTQTPATAARLPSFVALFQKTSPSVVNISATHPLPLPHDWLSRRDQELWRTMVRSLGSGFVLDHAGHIVTCASVVQDAEEIEVILKNGRRLKSSVVAADELSDIAVLSIPPQQSPSPLPTGRLQDVRLGDWVAAFGYPFGLTHSITAGMVSAIRPAESLKAAHGLILSDLAINPGCNGGPLVDMQGRVVGINLISAQTEGSVGLAIPIEDVLPILESLKAGRRQQAPWLGLSVQALDASLAASFSLSRPEGALVTRVAEKSPAIQAGITPGDVVVSLGDRPVGNPIELIDAARKTAVGRPVTLEIIHQGKIKSVRLIPRSSP